MCDPFDFPNLFDFLFFYSDFPAQVTPPPPKHTAATAAPTPLAQGKPSPPAPAPVASGKAGEQQSDCLFVGFFPGFAPNKDQILAVRNSRPINRGRVFFMY